MSEVTESAEIPKVRSRDDRVEASIIVVNYNTCEQTLACLDSVVRQGLGSRVEIVLVDNGSSDDSVHVIRETYPEVIVVEAGENLGFARGVNLGVRHSSKNFVLLLNPDAVVQPGSLESMFDFAAKNLQFGMYGGRNVQPNGDVDPSSCWGDQSLWSLTSFALGLSTAFKGSLFFDPESLGRWQRDSVREVPVITGCLLLISRAHWDRLGGMDEAFFLYGEDADFSFRARRLGLRPVIVPDAVIIHEGGGSTSSAGAKKCMVMAGKATLLTRSWTPWRARIGIGLLQLGALTRGLGEVITQREHSWMIVWQRRRQWREGYPHAEAAIFGRPLGPGIAA